jgi:hypothetical protein
MTQDFDNFVGTRAVSKQHAFDVDALTAWLETKLDGFKGPLTVEPSPGLSPSCCPRRMRSSASSRS